MFTECLHGAGAVLGTGPPGEHFVIIVARDPGEQNIGADSTGEDEQ